MKIQLKMVKIIMKKREIIRLKLEKKDKLNTDFDYFNSINDKQTNRINTILDDKY
jgi:hypothetical protein